MQGRRSTGPNVTRGCAVDAFQPQRWQQAVPQRCAGLRPHYHAHYYGAFVLDPDGNNVEAVCHAPA